MSCEALTLLRADPQQFGAQISQALWSQEGLSLLGTDEYAWNDGGCLLLADGLRYLLGPQAELVALVGRGNRIGQHFLATVDGWYLDSKGAFRAAELLRYWEETEYLARPQITPIELAHLTTDIPRDQVVSAQISVFLAEVLQGTQITHQKESRTWQESRTR